MSLYTPVFPPTDPPADRTPSSSSLSSVEAERHQHGLSYSSRLAQWHLAIASLPYELCSPSAPLSPTSQTRSANLQSEIEKAVREGRNITDFCKLRSTKLGYATKQPAHSGFEQGDGVPWILAETEEEWFQWEREAAQRRRKGKERANDLPPSNTQSQSQNAHDKVVSWKAGLLPPSASPATAPSAPSASTGRSSLGFPVVKRSTMVKGNKLKTNKPATQIDPAPRPNPAAQCDGKDSPALRTDDRAIDTAHVDTGGVEHGSSLLESRLNPPPEVKANFFLNKVPENANSHTQDSFGLSPPSFPPDLITSTQKDGLGTVQPLRRSPPLSPSGPIQSQQEGDGLGTSTNEDDLHETRVERAPIPRLANPIASDELTNEVYGRQIPQATPPSPPYSSETSQQPVQQHPMPSDTDDIHRPVTRQENPRPLTPPPETENVEHVSNGMQPQTSPRTPERTPRHMPERNKSICPPGGVGSVGMMNGHMTPDAAINGANVARGMLFPCAPERQSKALASPLTTSRKSRPRPRPPSRKHSVQNMDIDLDGAASEVGDGPDPSPAKSDRSYFSSPASGSSSDSDDSGASMLFVPGSPTSPFNLSRFAPLAQSTQVNPPGSPTPLRSRRKSRTQSQSQKGVYNSQFDVDARVDQLSNFMRQDVDLDAWVRATDTEGDADGESEDDDAHDVFAVEEMTKSCPLSFGSS